MDRHLEKWKSWLLGLVLAAWGLQLIWLAWHFAPEARDLVWRIAHQEVGAAIRQQDPYYRWLTSLAAIIPPQATYIFLDDYAAGKEILARYTLAPRRHILLRPNVPPSFLFYAVKCDQASFAIVRKGYQALDPVVSAALKSPAFRRVELAGPGLVFRVDYTRIIGEFYD
jgi:hypothetical protein